MKTRILSLAGLILVIMLSGCRYTKNRTVHLNLDFEHIENGFPIGWKMDRNSFGYVLSIDSTEVQHGKYSVVIESTNNDLITNPALLYTLPDNYAGKRITLSGYIKTENVTEGYAGLCLNIEPDITYNDMFEKGVTGTTDWQKYEITLDLYPEQTKQITVGGVIYGKGKMWLDNLKVTIDGKNIRKVKPYKPEPFPAKDDKEFRYGSNIDFVELTEKKIENLELLGRVWGFLKYHHPAIAKGNYNWDNELFRILPDYLKVNSSQQRDTLLIGWINKFGRIAQCKTRLLTLESAFLKPDLSWMEDGDISMELRKLLLKIYSNRNQGNNYYVRICGGGNPVFSNEITYKTIDYPDMGFQLLALFRYWNMIHYFYPNKYLTDKDWDTVLKEYIPYFMDAPDRLEYEKIMAKLITEICDSHAFLIGFDQIELLRGNRIIPVRVQFIENKLVVTECYKNPSELEKGDIITHIEGKQVKAIVDSMKRYCPASNEATRMRDISDIILRSNQSTLQINYISSSSKTEQKAVNTEELQHWIYHRYRVNDTIASYKLIDENIGYIHMGNINNEDVSALKKEFANTKGIIIDIRNYPSIYCGYSLGSYFTWEITPFAKATHGNTNNPGEFNFTPLMDHIPESDEYYSGKLIVIANEETQSMAEDHVMTFQAGDNTTVIGSPTAGADGRTSPIILPGGLETRISGVGFYYPDGREIQRVGIIPDIMVKPTIKGIREERDELLEKAIEFIRKD